MICFHSRTTPSTAGQNAPVSTTGACSITLQQYIKYNLLDRSSINRSSAVQILRISQAQLVDTHELAELWEQLPFYYPHIRCYTTHLMSYQSCVGVMH